ADARTAQQQLEASRTDAEARNRGLEQVQERLRSTIDELVVLCAAKSGDEYELARAQPDTQATRRELDATIAQLEAASQEITAARDEASQTRAEFDAAQAELEL